MDFKYVWTQRDDLKGAQEDRVPTFRPNLSATNPAGKAATRAPIANMAPTKEASDSPRINFGVSVCALVMLLYSVVVPLANVILPVTELSLAVVFVVVLVGGWTVSWGSTGDVQASAVPAQTAPKATAKFLISVWTSQLLVIVSEYDRQ